MLNPKGWHPSPAFYGVPLLGLSVQQRPPNGLSLDWEPGGLWALALVVHSIEDTIFCTGSLMVLPCNLSTFQLLLSSPRLSWQRVINSSIIGLGPLAEILYIAKHYLDDPTNAVLSALRGVTLTNPSLLLDETNKIVYRHPSSITSPKNVSVVCGGGSGHEPGFSAFVGQGALTACVAGTIFASPSAQQVRTCLSQRLPPGTQGIVVIVTNYTGDVLNFGMGVEKARAIGKKVEMVIVADDVGVGRAKGGKVGRRGLSGTALVVKICGALAEAGAPVEDCAKVGRLVVDNLVSVGASLSRVHVPGRSLQEAKDEEERLGPGLVEIGMGIHNEPGCEKVKTDLPGLVKIMLAQMLDQNDKDRAYVKIEKGDDTILLVNNFGGTSNLELSAAVTEIVGQLGRDYGLKPKRIISGTLFGSLNGPGFIISILRLADTGLGTGKSLLELLDAPAQATGWPASIRPETWDKGYEEIQATAEDDKGDTRPTNLKGEYTW